ECNVPAIFPIISAKIKEIVAEMIIILFSSLLVNQKIKAIKVRTKTIYSAINIKNYLNRYTPYQDH
ncbi:hypothetical protein V7081_22775, partial [Priestia megaterium]